MDCDAVIDQKKADEEDQEPSNEQNIANEQQDTVNELPSKPVVDEGIETIARNQYDLEAEEFDREFEGMETCAISLDDDDEIPDDLDDEGITDAMDVEAENDVGEENTEPVVDESECTMRHTDSVLTCAIRRNAKELEICTGSMDETAIIWTIRDGQAVEKRRLEDHTDSIVCVAYSHTGEFIATASYDATVKIWNADSGDLVATCEGPTQELEWCRWHPKGNVLIAGCTDTTVWMWWAPTGKVMQAFSGHGGVVSSGTFTSSGKLIVTGANDGGVIVWNPKEGLPNHNFTTIHRDAVVSIMAYPDENKPLIITGAGDGSSKIINAETGKLLQALDGHRASVEAIAFNSIDSNLPLLATGDLDGRLIIREALNFNLRTTVPEAHPGGIVALQWASGPGADHLLVSCSCATDGISKLWDGRSGECLREFSGHQRLPVLSIDALVVGNELVVITASDDDTCKLFRHNLEPRT